MSSEPEGVVNHWDRVVSILVILVGTGLCAVAVGADYVGLGDPASFGPKQVGLALVGEEPRASTETGPVNWQSAPHWAMSTWWFPQSVMMPPAYSYHQRKF